jgi:hypothetical protein
LGSRQDGRAGIWIAGRASSNGSCRDRHDRPPGQGAQLRLPLNDLIARDKRAWVGEGGIHPDAPVVRAGRSKSKTDFYDVTEFSLPRICDAGATELSLK